MSDSTLYIVATPIGNLSDMVPRAVEVLQTAAFVAAEDTRHSAKLMSYFNIDTPLIAYHDHSDSNKLQTLLGYLIDGHDIALISDAGTPLISDPGYKLVREARKLGASIVPIPGPCAAIAALSAAGLPTDRFVFEGFLPAKGGARKKRLTQLAEETRTLIFYESPHRIVDTLSDMKDIFGGDRDAVVARELTKTYESIMAANLTEIDHMINEDPQQRKGEFVVIVAGAPEKDSHVLDSESERVLAILLTDLSVKQSSELAAKITGISKKVIYQAALDMRNS